MQAPSRSSEIAAELRDEILRGQYRSGERLPSERDLAERFGVHRGAVREAFKCLEQLGLAVIRPGGARVAPLAEASLDIVHHLLELEDPPNPAMVDQVLEVMSGLFSMAARLAAERADDAQRSEILAVIQDLRADDGRDMAAHVDRVQRLGDLFVEAADNLVMRLVRRGVKTQFMERSEFLLLNEPPPQAEREPHLKRIAAAIEARDGRDASEAVLQLTRAIRAHVVARLTERRAERLVVAREERMTRKITIPLLVLAMAILGAYVLVKTAPSVEYVPPARAVQAVRVMEALPQTVPMLVRSQGTVAPRTESSLVPEVSGRVVWISPALSSGGFFDLGDPLIRIEPDDYEAALTRATAALSRATGERRHASAELKRQEGLAKRNIASNSQLSEARRAGRGAEAAWEEAKVGLAQAERDLKRTEITAPFEGRVRSENVDVGQFVSRGNPVAVVYATDFAEIRLPVPDHQLAFLRITNLRGGTDGDGPLVRLHARFAGEEHEWQGRVVRTEGEIDPRSRMVHVVARVKDPYGTGDPGSSKSPLAVGLFVRAEIEGAVAENVIVVPRYAMRDATTVLVVDVEDRLHVREVDVLRIDRDDVLIRATLAPGERISLSPLQVVVEGMQVKPIADDGVGS